MNYCFWNWSRKVIWEERKVCDGIATLRLLFSPTWRCSRGGRQTRNKEKGNVTHWNFHPEWLNLFLQIPQFLDFAPNWCTSDGDSRSKVGSLKFMYFGEQLKIRIYLPRKEEPFLLQIIIEALSCIGNLAFEETFGQIWHICYLSKEIYMTIDIFLVMVIGGSWWWWLVVVVCGEMVVMMRPVHLHDLIQQLVCFLQVHLGKNSMAPPPTLLITRSLIQYFLNTANTSKTSTTQTTTIEHK